MTSIIISLVVTESIIIMLSSYIVDFLLICISTLCYLTSYADPQLKIAIIWSHKTIVLYRALRVNHIFIDLIEDEKFNIFLYEFFST